MYTHSNFKALFRAIGIMSAVVAIISGVTFAALQSQQAVLAGNTITSASADLKLSTDNNNFGSSMPGFTFSDVIPGGPAVPAAGYSLYLKNTGSLSQTLKVSIGTTPANPGSADLSKVSAIFTRVPGGTPQTFTLAALETSYATGGLALTDSLNASSVLSYKVQISMSADAFNGSGFTIGNVDFVFKGTAVTP